MNKSKLCLGTVQFGMCYGVNNALGRKPGKDECFDIINEALLAGITCFDTAHAYGNAESLLGEFPWGDRKPQIISKLPPRCTNTDVKDKLVESFNSLRMKKIYGYMLHCAEDMYRKSIMESMELLKEQKLVDKIGVSVYEPEDAMKAVSDKRIDIIQIPYNVLDQRLDKVGFFEMVQNGHKEIYARSAFLQGLLLMDPNKAESKVNGSGKWIKNFHSIVKDRGYTPSEAAMLYCMYHPGIDYVVFGVDTPQQLKCNVAIQKEISDFDGCYEDLSGAFLDVPREILMPSLWG